MHARVLLVPEGHNVQWGKETEDRSYRMLLNSCNSCNSWLQRLADFLLNAY
jgi:hypothetical protein